MRAAGKCPGSSAHVSATAALPQVRTYDDPSVAKYRQHTTMDKTLVPLSREIEGLRDQFNAVLTKLQDVRHRVARSSTSPPVMLPRSLSCGSIYAAARPWCACHWVASTR